VGREDAMQPGGADSEIPRQSLRYGELRARFHFFYWFFFFFFWYVFILYTIFLYLILLLKLIVCFDSAMWYLLSFSQYSLC
jgi:hypothetical protein